MPKETSLFLLLALQTALALKTGAVEIPLDAIAPVRIGYLDLQRVFDSYPEKSFAEGDLLREVEKRKRELGRRQNEINTLREQVAADEATLVQAKAGRPVRVPPNIVPQPPPPAAGTTKPAPVPSTGTVRASTATAVESYPTEDPLAGLPGHPGATIPAPAAPAASLPGLTTEPDKPAPALLDLLAGATEPALLNAEALSALEKRAQQNRLALARAVTSFKTFRGNAVGDMKQLQTEKTYGVMSKIYAMLQTLARDEGITVVIDKAYVLYGEETVDLSDKLISLLQAEAP